MTCWRYCVVQQCCLKGGSEKIMKRIWGFDVRSETMAALMEKVQHTVRVSNVFHIPGLTADHHVIAIATHCYTLFSLFQSQWLSLVGFVCSAQQRNLTSLSVMALKQASRQNNRNIKPNTLRAKTDIFKTMVFCFKFSLWNNPNLLKSSL